MTMFHAVAQIDHHQAQVLQFDAKQSQTQKIKAHSHHTRQHGSEVRTGHEFFGDVCTALQGIPEVLIAGSHTALSDFKHYVDKHRPQLAPHIVGYEAIDHPTEAQLLALARDYFLKYDRMAGTPVPT